MEITPRVEDALRRLHQAGWLVINQHVFTAAASRRGHNGKLRQTLGEVGVLPYYTFTVKGYMENSYNFATNGRAVQEQIEEKVFGKLGDDAVEELGAHLDHPGEMAAHLAAVKAKQGIAFLASDRNVLNLPGVGKSLSFRVIGITRYGRRILEFDHDATRRHSPIIEKLGKIIIIESKSVSEYLAQLAEIGEDPADYKGLYGYSIGVTDPRLPIFDYPEYEFSVTEEMTNLDIS
jgi:lysine 2,3-aminomutase